MRIKNTSTIPRFLSALFSLTLFLCRRIQNDDDFSVQKNLQNFCTHMFRVYYSSFV